MHVFLHHKEKNVQTKLKPFMLRSSIITPRDEILAANESENRITKHAYDHDSVETIF